MSENVQTENYFTTLIEWTLKYRVLWYTVKRQRCASNFGAPVNHLLCFNMAVGLLRTEKRLHHLAASIGKHREKGIAQLGIWSVHDFNRRDEMIRTP